MIKLLIEKYNRPIKIANAVQYTPAILAACGGHLELVQFLVSNQYSDLNEITNEGDTVLTLSCYCGHIEIVEWLLDNGASLNQHNLSGLSPLISATNGGHANVCEMLIKRGSNIEEKDNYGHTSLLLAVRRNSIETVKILAAYGSNFKEMTNSGLNIYNLSQNPLLRQWITENYNRTPIEISILINRPDIAINHLYNGACLNFKMFKEILPTIEDPKTKHFVSQALKPWSPSRHKLFSSSMQKFAESIVKLRYQLQYYEHLPFLPMEIWEYIINMFHRNIVF
jgi:hypothetical protein